MMISRAGATVISGAAKAFSVSVEDTIAFTDDPTAVFAVAETTKLKAGAAAESLSHHLEHSAQPNNLLLAGSNLNNIMYVAVASGTAWAVANMEVVRGEELHTPDEPQRSAWEILRDLSGSIEGPEDWASEADYYLHGTPKRGPAPDEE